jgi:DNA-binding transcriptional LysR family regulator
MELDLRDLRYFQCIAELGHLGRAADRLGRSQPALTKCIRRLEDHLGATLFERKGRGIRLTAVGEMLLGQTRRLRSAADATYREVQEFARGGAGRVRLGCGPIIADYALPTIFDLILTRSPGITLEVNIGMNYDLREQLRRGALDLIIGLVQEQDGEFNAHPLLDDVVVVAANADHPIFANPDPQVEDLTPYRWVLPMQQVPSRKWLDLVFATRGLTSPRAVIEANSIPMLNETIGRAELLYFVSRNTLARQKDQRLREVPIEATTLRRKLGLTYPKAHLPPAVARLVDLLREEGSGGGDSRPAQGLARGKTIIDPGYESVQNSNFN